MAVEKMWEVKVESITGFVNEIRVKGTDGHVLPAIQHITRCLQGIDEEIKLTDYAEELYHRVCILHNLS